jgi:hypothetical protein
LCGECLKPFGDVYRIAEQVVVVADRLAVMDADAELQRFLGAAEDPPDDPALDRVGAWSASSGNRNAARIGSPASLEMRPLW